MNKKQLKKRVFAVILFALAASALGFAQASAPNPAPTDPAHVVPVMDGGIGPCTADFIITDSTGAPLYAAKVKVHIAYGFMNVRKLDLELSTNVDGKARFTGLPDRIKHGLYFEASQGDRSGEAFDDPTNTCKAQFTVTLMKKTQ